MKSLISVDDLKRLEADDHDIVSIDVDTFVTHDDPLSPIFFILEQKQVGVCNVKLAFPVDEVDRFVYDRRFVVKLNKIVT